MNRCSLELCNDRFFPCGRVATPSASARASYRRDEMNDLEAFAIQFEKEVDIQQEVDIQKEFDINVEVQATSAMADVKAAATALGPNSHTETLGLTTTTAVAGVGSSSSSISESLSLASKVAAWHWCVAFENRPSPETTPVAGSCGRRRHGRPRVSATGA